MRIKRLKKIKSKSVKWLEASIEREISTNYNKLDEIEYMLGRFNIEEIREPNPKSTPEQSDKEDWLGCYYSMRRNQYIPRKKYIPFLSREEEALINSQTYEIGRICLNKEKLSYFILYLTKELIEKGHQIDANIFKGIISNVIKKTIYHELFHHYCDFVRTYRDSVSKYRDDDQKDYDSRIEEALAVAFSNHYLCLENNDSPLNQDFFDLAYFYRSPGYRDWENYKELNVFYKAVAEYSGYRQMFNYFDETSLSKVCRSYLEALVNNADVEYQITQKEFEIY